MIPVRPNDLAHDAVAGAVTAVLLIPQALAYALLAGMPPEAGLSAAMAPPLIYAVFGTSPALSVGPVAVVSLMVATTLGPLHAAGSAEYAHDATTLALLSGVMLLALGLLRLGVLVNFLSFPVISGFAMGAALLIILSQLPQMLGLHLAASGGALHQGRQLLEALPSSSAIPLGIAAISIGSLLAARGPLTRWLLALGVPRRFAVTIPSTMPLLLVVAGSAGAIGLRLDGHGVQLVGHLAGGLPALRLPAADWDQCRTLAGPAALIGLVGYLEGISIAQLLARRHRHEVRANRELVAIGLANVVAALTISMPVAGSLSRSVVNDSAGARTRLAGVIAVGFIAVSSLTLTPLLEHLPRAVLAAIIMVAVLRLLDWRGQRQVWR
ncbi:MAG: hypothetical protein ISP90_03420 [Nevskia sp.]|nr:hypothetical protein [Nevskia sp.]